MKLAHYFTRFVLADGGVVRAVLDMAQALSARGHDVTIITQNDTDIPAAWKSGGAGVPRVVNVGEASGLLGRLDAGALSKTADAIRGADVLHLHTPWETSNPQIAAIARREKVPYIVSIHGMLDDWCMTQRAAKKKLYLALAGRKLLENAAYVHCTAQAEKDQSEKWFPRGRGRVIPLVFDLEPFRTLPGPALAREKHPSLATHRPKVLFLSRVHPKKGIELLIDSVPLLQKAGIDPAVSIAGTGDTDYIEQLKKRVASMGLGDRVAFLGLVTGAEKLSVYEAADIFVLPTSQENFGFVIPEAMACGKAVVTTRGVDIWPELDRSGGAVIVDSTPAAIAAAVARLLKDPAALRTMGERGRSWVFAELDGRRVVERYETMYADARTKP